MSLLRNKTPFYIDFETHMTSEISLKKQTLQAYMEQSHVTMLSYKFGDGSVTTLTPELIDESIPLFKMLAEHDDVVFVAHNSAFDFAVWHEMLGLPYPKHGLCTMEMAQGAWPNHPGGYGLENLGKTRPNMPQKISIDLKAGKHTDEELRKYVERDVECCVEIYKQALEQLPDDELALAELTGFSREIVLFVNQQKLDDCVDAFNKLAVDAAADAIKALGIDGDTAFGWDDPENKQGLRSVKPQTMKQVLASNLNFQTDTISVKKLNPEHLRQNPQASVVINHASVANRALWHRRNTAKFTGMTDMKLSLCYFAAHTGRWSGKGSGKGLNVQNMPKRDKSVAKPFRSMLVLPDEYCWVRGDAANLEYRIECLLTGSEHGKQLFSNDPNADPYTSFGLAAIGKLCNKWDPIRQVWKAAVLGLGYGMSVGRWMSELALMLAKPQVFGVTLKDLEDICVDNGWGKPRDRYVQKCMREQSVPWQVASVAEHTHKLFHQVHPEFMRTARWLEETINAVSASRSPAKEIERQFNKRSAPPREWLDLLVDDSLQGRSVRVRCGKWTPTVCWRDIAVRPYRYAGKRQLGLTSMQGGNKGFRSLTKSILIENICQSAGRNVIAQASLELAKHGYKHQCNVHDEILVRVAKTPHAVMEARDRLIDVLGPNNTLGYEWAALIKPEEICVTQSFHEDEDVMPQLWADLDAGKSEALDNLV